MNKYLSILIVVLALSTNTVSAEKVDGRKLTINQAKALVFTALRPEEKNLPSLSIENGASDSYNDPNFPRYLFFMVIWAGPKNGGSVSAGYYDVDPYTGDVFYATSGCLEVKNKQLESLQKKYRRTILYLPQKKYDKLKTKGPMCDG